MFFFGRPRAGDMSPQDAIAGAAQGTVTVIDVREQAEVAASGKARGALHIPLTRLRDMADPRHPDFRPELKAGERIAIYCASGGRSASAVSMLRNLGYDNVHNIGGFIHWMQAGGGVEKP